MKKLFLDTGAFVALEDKSDEHHENACEFRDGILKEGHHELCTSFYVLDETLTLIRCRIGIAASIRFCRRIRLSKVVSFLQLTNSRLQKAFDIFQDYDDKDFSFTDCTSFAIMQDLGIKTVFGFDRHFLQMGYHLRP